jgi:two-component system, NarL family, response regulator LiaR
MYLLADEDMSMDAIRAMIAHDHPMVSAGMLILETARHLCADLAPDMLVIEMTIADEMTLPLTEREEPALPRPQVFVLRGSHTGTYVFGLSSTGSDSMPTEQEALHLIAETLQAGLHSKADVPNDWRLTQPSAQQLEPGLELPPELTVRELEVLRLLTVGKTNQAMSRQLGVTERTIEYHLSNIYKKLRVRRRSEAMAWASRAGLVEVQMRVREEL